MKLARPALHQPVAGAPTAFEAMGSAPLRLFQLSPHNVRRTYDEAEVRELAADIRVRGLKQNLIVETAPEGGGRLAVVAGGRRLRALWHLVDEEVFGLDFDVPYMLEDPRTGRETSLAENIQKVALNPVDEIEAYAQIVADHHEQPDPILYCAQRFATTRRHVEQQLRLADLAPEILDALRAGAIDITAARAYASTADHAEQLTVYLGEERRGFGRRHDPRSIRDSLQARSYPAGNMQAVYVGLDVYRAAGGRTDRDLFFGADEGERLLDPSLLDRLAREKAEGELLGLAADDGLASGVLTLGFNAAPLLPKPPATHVIRRGATPDDLSAEERPAAIGVYTLATDGSGLVLAALMTAIALPARPRAGDMPPPLEESVPIDRPRPTMRDHLTAPPLRREPVAQQLARVREQELQRFAAMLAARKIAAAAPGADRFVLPEPDRGLDPFSAPVDVAADGDILVTIQIRVHPDELEAMRGAAEAAVSGAEAVA